MNSTRRGSVSAKETRHGQVLCSKMWLFVSCAIQIVSESNNTTISSASLTRGLKSDKLGVNDPQAISASVTGPEDGFLIMEPPPNQPESRASESQEAQPSLRSLASGVETSVSRHKVATKATQLSESLAAPDPDNA